MVPRLCPAGPGADAQGRRCRGPRQPARPQGAVVRTAIEAVGARLLFLPPYSSDFNPIENAFSKLKALLRKAAARTIDDLWRVIGESLDASTPTQCANYFAAAGHDAYQSENALGQLSQPPRVISEPDRRPLSPFR